MTKEKKGGKRREGEEENKNRVKRAL